MNMSFSWDIVAFLLPRRHHPCRALTHIVAAHPLLLFPIPPAASYHPRLVPAVVTWASRTVRYRAPTLHRAQPLVTYSSTRTNNRQATTNTNRFNKVKSAHAWWMWKRSGWQLMIRNINICSLFHQLFSTCLGSSLTNTVLQACFVLSFTNVFFSFNLVVSVTSPMVPGSIRNIHEGKVSGQMANAANHHSDRHGTEDYLNIVHRLSSEVRRCKSLLKKKKKGSLVLWWWHTSYCSTIAFLCLISDLFLSVRAN